MPLPLSLASPPVIAAVLELRFQSEYPDDAIFGIVFAQIKNDFPKTEKLPILQMPDEIRTNDPSLRFQPYYRLSEKNYIVQIGPRTISLAPTDYPGWTQFFGKTKTLLNAVFGTGVVSKVTRLGLRYTNALQNHGLDALKFGVTLFDEAHSSPTLFLRTNVKRNDYSCTLQISAAGSYVKAGQKITAPILDLDTSLSQDMKPNSETMNPIIDGAHSVTKDLFFGLLKEESLVKMEPDYAN